MTTQTVAHLVNAYKIGMEMQRNALNEVRTAIYDIVKEHGNIKFKNTLYVKPGGYAISAEPQEGWNLLHGAFFDTRHSHLFPEGRVSYRMTERGKETDEMSFASSMENNGVVLKEIINSI